MHAERFQWHNDDPDYDGYGVLSKLQFQHVKDEGYASLRCAWKQGCPYEVRPYADLESTVRGSAHKRSYKQAFEELLPGVEVPKTVGAPCCAQFAVTRETIQSRAKPDYARWRRWLLETELNDDVSGRTFEYLWHSMLLFDLTDWR